MTWDDTTGDGALLSDLQMVHRAGVIQWRSEARDRRFHRCDRRPFGGRRCGGIIWRRALHHHVITERRDLRLHHRCPGEERDTLPEYGPAERGIAALEWLMMAGAWAFALAVVGALCMALGYEW